MSSLGPSASHNSHELILFTRQFPWELLLHTFELCDSSTLARAGRVSSDWLLGTSAMLYRDREVVVKSADALEALFCERDDKLTSSRLRAPLSLSQTRRLHLDFTTLPCIPKLLNLSYARLLQHTDPLLLESLTLSYQYIHRDLLRPLHRVLLPHLNPRRVAYDVRNRPLEDPAWYNDGAPQVLAGWDTEVVELKGLLIEMWDGRQWTLACLPPPSSVHQRRTVRLHPFTLLSPQRPDVLSFLEYVLASKAIFALDVLQAGSLVLVVASREERDQAEEAVVQVDKEWRSLFSVVWED